jgi:hypothetical protein
MKKTSAFRNPSSLRGWATWRGLPRFRFPLSAFRFFSGPRFQVSGFGFPLSRFTIHDSRFRFALITSWFPKNWQLAIGNWKCLAVICVYLCPSVARIPHPAFYLPPFS